MKFVGKVRNAIAVALMLWCAGAGCVLVSYARAAAISGSENSDSVAHSPGAMASSHESCHAARNGNKQKVANRTASAAAALDEIGRPAPTRSDAMSCCPLTSGTIAASSRVQANDYTSATTAAASTFLTSSSHATQPLAVPLRLPNQHHLYLRGCVFLI